MPCFGGLFELMVISVISLPLESFGYLWWIVVNFRLNSLRPFIIQSPRRVKSRNALEREERAAGNTARQGLETHRKKCSFKWSIAPWARYQVTTQSLNSPPILGRSHLAPGNYYDTGSVRFFPSRLHEVGNEVTRDFSTTDQLWSAEPIWTEDGDGGDKPDRRWGVLVSWQKCLLSSHVTHRH
jgi:hypothetical protein